MTPDLCDRTIARDLVRWFERDHRSMPWRDDPTPYKVWISEIMLQQTQVATAIPYFERFLARFPDIRALANSDLDDVLRVWEGLGYYARARNLHKAARYLVDHCHGTIPNSSSELIRLPGIGLYTAAAIASIAFGEHVPVVDGNVLRVFCRFWGIRKPAKHPSVADIIRKRLEILIANVSPSSFNQAIMELGAVTCTVRNPLCTACLLRHKCYAFRHDQTDVLPVIQRSRKTPHRQMAAGVIWKRGRLLLARRPETGMLGGLWEFPGGGWNEDEGPADALERSLRKSTGLRVYVGASYAAIRHAYSHFRITVTPFRCEWRSGRPVSREWPAFRWIWPRNLKDYPLHRTSRKIAAAILSRSLPAS